MNNTHTHTHTHALLITISLYIHSKLLQHHRGGIGEHFYLNTKTHSSKEMADFCYENADAKGICYCKRD